MHFEDVISTEAEKKAFLPTQFSIGEEGNLLYKGQSIANGFGKVKQVTEIRNVSGKKVISIGINFVVGNTEKEVEITQEQLLNVKAPELLFTRLYLENPRKRNLELFKQTLLYQVANTAVVVKYKIDQLGFSKLANGERIYAMGNKILGKTSCMVCHEDSLMNYKLQYTPLSDVDFAEGLKRYLMLHPDVAPVLMAYLTLALSRQVFLDAGLLPKFSLFITGVHQSFKTTLSTLYFNIYNRHEDIEACLHNLTSTEMSLVRTLTRQKDSPTIVDDLNRSDSRITEKRQEKAASMLIRVAANNVARESMHESFEPKTQLVICGEYTLKNPSTNNRIILLEFEKNMFEKSKITDLQKRQDVIPMFAEHYIKWLLENYDRKVKYIKARSDEYKDLRAEDDNYQERLNMSANILKLAFDLFLEFCKYKRWDHFSDFNHKFKVAVNNVVTNQIEALELDETDTIDFVAEAYISIMHRGDFSTGKGKPSLWENQIYISEAHDTVYVPGRILTDAVNIQLGREYECATIANAFDMAGLLWKDNSKKGCRCKKAGGKRCYHIKLSDWENYIQEKKMMEGN